MTDLSSCTGCGLRRPVEHGPVHAYVTTSPECWALFTQLPTQTERMFTDAYMAQHPDGDDPRQVHGDVLAAWHETEETQIEEWTGQTLTRLYR